MIRCNVKWHFCMLVIVFLFVGCSTNAKYDTILTAVLHSPSNAYQIELNNKPEIVVTYGSVSEYDDDSQIISWTKKTKKVVDISDTCFDKIVNKTQELESISEGFNELLMMAISGYRIELEYNDNHYSMWYDYYQISKDINRGNDYIFHEESILVLEIVNILLDECGVTV